MDGYVIRYSGILEYGYVKLWLFKRPKGNFEPTIFRFKFIAQICSFVLNKSSKDFKSFYVMKY